MERKHLWVRRTATTTALLWLAAAGCADDPKRLPAATAGSGGTADGSAGLGGASGATAGASPASAGAGTSAAGDTALAGEGGAGGDVAETAGAAGAAGAAGTAENEPCSDGSTRCEGMTQCTDLAVGNAHGAGVINCGTCGTTCSLDNATSATCTSGACAPTCDTGFADCNASTANDGCETDATTVENCGSCQHACSMSGATSQACVSEKCAPTCAPHYADCNQATPLSPDDGCEVYLDLLDQCAKDCTTAGVACDPTQVCNDGSCVAPSGLVSLSTPLTAAAQNQRFADLFPPSANLEGASLTVRAYAPGATTGTLVMYVQDTSSNLGNSSLRTELSSISNKWADLTLHIASASPFDATSVKQINVEVYAGTTNGPWTNPTLVYVDGVRSSNLAVNDTFDASLGNFVKSSTYAVAGSTIGWTQSIP